ncbi:hypothetical protein ACMYYO_00225 [Dermacoccaceae bacterium W4C1]
MSTTVSSHRQDRRSSMTDAVGVRLHTRGEASPEWVNAAVLPLWRAARADGVRLVQMRRGWLAGPHVLVASAGTGSAGDGPDWAALIADGPRVPAAGRSILTPTSYAQMAAERGRLERVPAPYPPLAAEGAIIPVQHHELVRGERPLDELTGVLLASLAPAVADSVRVIAEGQESGATHLVDVLTVVADSHALGAGFGCFSLRSHVEALLTWMAPGANLRGSFVRRYQDQQRQIIDEVQKVLEHRRGGRWRSGVDYARGMVDEHVRRGDLADRHLDAVVDEQLSAADSGTNSTSHPDTDFHRSVHDSGATAAAGPWFAGYRFLVNQVYTQLPLLGITPLQRAFGCFAVAEAVDDITGTRWDQRLNSLSATQQGAPS